MKGDDLDYLHLQNPHVYMTMPFQFTELFYVPETRIMFFFGLIVKTARD